MERELFAVIMHAVSAIADARRYPPRARYADRDVLAVAFWAAIHDRPISWATRRSNWPWHDRTRPLPCNATMSRRLKRPSITALIDRVIEALAVDCDDPGVLIIDGRRLRIARHTSDPDAAAGGPRGASTGYALHQIVDSAGNCRGRSVQPMNVHEQVVARALVEQLEVSRETVLLADKKYDSNALYAAAGSRGIQLIAQRRYPGRGLGRHRHSEHRLRGIALQESTPSVLSSRRLIEGCFGTQGNIVGGLGPLPNHVRRQHRVARWVDLKIVIDAAHRTRRQQQRHLR